MKRNSILFVIALVAAIAMAGSASAAESVSGQVNSIAAEGQILTLYLDDWPDDYTTKVVTNNVSGGLDYYGFDDIAAMLGRHGSPSSYNATIEMRCSGVERNIFGELGNSYTNTLRNTTPTTAHVVNGANDGQGETASLMEIEPCPVPTYIDLNVSEIDVNPSCNTGGDEIFVNESNEICATIWNYGTGDVTGDFDVSFYDDTNSVNIGTATVSGLLAGQNKTVCVYWTPSSADYPDLSGEHPAIGMSATVNATVDCNGAVTESDETNNTLLLNTEVSANGYKSKNFDSDPSTEPLKPFKYTGDLFTGGLAYNVSGVKAYPFASGDNQTRVHNITLPLGATVKEARLYITWYDYYANPVPGCLANLSVDFAGPGGSATFTTPDAMYTDQKAYGTYDTPKGKYAYNVTSLVSDTSNDYSVTVENIDPTNSTTLLGGILVVVYEGGEEEIQLWWQEGCDLLSGRTTYCSSTTEATATVSLPGSIDLAKIGSANLITFVDQGMSPGSNLLFNGINIKTDAWDTPTEAYPVSKINVENVLVDVLASSNNMGFQDTGTSGMQANLAFLVIKQSDVLVEMDMPEYVMSTPGTMVAKIMIRDIDNYGAGTITLDYNSSVVHVTGVADGPFSTVLSSNINNTAGTVKISAQNTVGVSDDIEFARITFEAVGGNADTTPLTLSVQTLKDISYVSITSIINNGLITLSESEPPVMDVGTADPNPIIQTIVGGRDRNVSRNTSTLSIDVSDSGSGVASVIIDLSSIGGVTTQEMDNGGSGATYSVNTDATKISCINLVHNLVVTATDNNGNIATSTIPLEVLRRGDVARNNKVDMGDALYIARNSVGLEPEADNWLLVGDVVGEGGIEKGDNEVDMADALYISRLTVGLELEEP